MFIESAFFALNLFISGAFIELVIVPGIRLQMNALGHGFDGISANQKVGVKGAVVADFSFFQKKIDFPAPRNV